MNKFVEFEKDTLNPDIIVGGESILLKMKRRKYWAQGKNHIVQLQEGQQKERKNTE